MPEKYIKAADCEKYFYEHLDDVHIAGAMNAIDEMPAADVVEVVRCKDCKYFNHKELECRCDGIVQDLADSGSFRLNFYLDDYCSYGVRKENDIWLKKNT